MKSSRRFALPLALTLMVTGCSAAVAEETESSTAFVSAVRLEESQIRAFVDQANVQSSISGSCSIEYTRFRITYANPTLPAGSAVTLHVGESYGYNELVGDGFPHGPFRTGSWGNTRDVPMASSAAGQYSAVTDAQSYGNLFDPLTGSGGAEIFPATIQFVFRIDLPGGGVLWDNHLERDYEVSGNGAACPGGSTDGFVLRASWGPF